MDDITIIELLAEGNVNAYRYMFMKYYSPLCEYASHFVADEDAEELVQDLMLFLWEHMADNTVIIQSLQSYLFASVKHRCLNEIKRNKYHARVHSAIYERLKHQFEEPNYYLANELSERIRLAIAKLPKKYRETFEMSRFGDLTNQQIALQLDVSVKTIEYRITQSLKILRKELKDFLPFVFFSL